MKQRERVMYAELTPMEFRERLRQAPIAYLPLGTLEWHGEHLPLGSDGLQSQGFFVHLAHEVGGVVLPMLFVGPDSRVVVQGREFYGMDNHGFEGESPHQLDGSAYWVEEGLFRQLLNAIFAQLARAGFRIVVAHGHGPSTKEFWRNAPQWSEKYGLVMLHCWREPVADEDDLGIQTDHAAANETSLMMALHPELVRMSELPKDPDKWPVAISGKDPRTSASSARGHEAIRLQGDRMAEILRVALARIRSTPTRALGHET
jgi:creatinine amidohydrolase